MIMVRVAVVQNPCFFPFVIQNPYLFLLLFKTHVFPFVVQSPCLPLCRSEPAPAGVEPISLPLIVQIVVQNPCFFPFVIQNPYLFPFVVQSPCLPPLSFRARANGRGTQVKSKIQLLPAYGKWFLPIEPGLHESRLHAGVACSE